MENRSLEILRSLCCSCTAFVVARLNRPRDILAKLIDWRGIHWQNERPADINAFPWINFRRLTMRRLLLLADAWIHQLADYYKKKTAAVLLNKLYYSLIFMVYRLYCKWKNAQSCLKNSLKISNVVLYFIHRTWFIEGFRAGCSKEMFIKHFVEIWKKQSVSFP